MKYDGVRSWRALFVLCGLCCSGLSAQFLDEFICPPGSVNTAVSDGWECFSGDGSARVNFILQDGYASILVDATEDTRNIWWALIKRCVSEDMDLSLLTGEAYELRIEARIRVSHAPRRVNLHLNTQRTMDFHSHLMEFDIPDSKNWHVISMTTRDFDARPGDIVNGQLALMDWGLDKYRVDVDYFKVDIVEIASAGPDKGVAVPYHPPVPDPEEFSHVRDVEADSTIDDHFPDMNFNDWYAAENGERADLLAVDETRFPIMRWNMGELKGKTVSGGGLLELTTYSVQRNRGAGRDFGMIRVVEILGGDPGWDQETVTKHSLLRGETEDEVLNSQMIIDVEVNEGRGDRTLIVISQPVLQRMVDGRTLGLAVRPLGAISAAFYALEYQGGKFCARLYLNIE